MTGEAKTLLGIGLVTLALFIGGIVALTRNSTSAPQQTADPAVLVRPDSNVTPASDAKVTLVEFGDFQCPFCAQAQPIIKQLLGTHPNQIRFVYRNYPLIQHPNAMLAAETAEAAGAQGQYWPMYALLFENQPEWADNNEPLPIFQGYAQQLQLNMEQFNQALTDHTFRAKIQQDTADGNLLGVNSTPAFFVDNQRFSGSLTELKTLIESKVQ